MSTDVIDSAGMARPQRARAQLAKLAPELDEVSEPADAARRAMLDRYVDAFEHHDLVELSEMFVENLQVFGLHGGVARVTGSDSGATFRHTDASVWAWLRGNRHRTRA